MTWSKEASADVDSKFVKFSGGERKTLRVISDERVAPTMMVNDRSGEAVVAWEFDVEIGDKKAVWSITSARLKRMLMDTFKDGLKGQTVSVKKIGMGTDTTWVVERVP